MKIGMLQCDDVPQALLERHGNYPDMIQRLLQTVDPTVQIRRWACHQGQIPDVHDDVDAWITTGSKHGANDSTPWIHQLGDFIRELWRLQRPLVGVCFGHQLIAQALGGRVERSSQGWGVGVSTNTLMLQQTWMMPWQGKDLRLLASHQDQVTVLPPDGVVLAQSAFCPIYMMQVGDAFLGIQGHPEFSKDYAADLMMLRHDSIQAERIKTGMNSLTLEVDDMLVGNWILNFMRQVRRA